MPAFFHNKIVKAVAIIGVSFIFLLVFIAVILASLNDARSTGGIFDSDGMIYPRSVDTSTSYNKGVTTGDAVMYRNGSGDYLPPIPNPNGYTAGLETYETTSYTVFARTKDFDSLCDSLVTLKQRPDTHFKFLTSSTNNCRATFYADESAVADVLATLTNFSGVEVSRDTSSVTRHKQQLESQTSILVQQLARVESSLAAAERQLGRLNELFNTNNDVTSLSAEVTSSLRYIDELTKKKINLISQLNNLYQQSSDLAERIDVVQFDVNINRANPIIVGKYERLWDQAWEELKDTYHGTLIGLTAFFGIFLLWLVRIVVYLLVLIIISRGLWKFVKLLWSRW